MRRSAAAAGSAAFFAIAPGVVAGVVPWLLTDWKPGTPSPYWAVARVAGAVLVTGGAVVLVQAFVRFVREGAGTPAPVAPTERLVVGGLYRYLRNPMYVAVIATIVGQALLLGRLGVLVYALVAAAAMMAFVKGYEEPRLAARYDAEYAEYRANVPGWWPRRTAWRQSAADTPL
ncbi:methyltransferase family protein [Rhizomonospora bruguierae]|uniref:methyltransferase family protein n=1 Tax=Rhizomonospora bruguierae TaxID=1581705 RepID=UPI001BCC8B80|nr:isoprenylcysteine carboxylmethyltransferase family protein [Micromonospora sp. NBRC 107566]